MSDKAWGGRFASDLDGMALQYSASVAFDKRLAEEDIEGSLAHVDMLGAQQILRAEEVQTLREGLHAVRDDVREGRFVWQAHLEDVHMNIEHALTARVGPVGGKLHTGRSRNDQVATDMRLWTKRACQQLTQRIDEVLAVLVLRASETLDVLLPGYTHLQRAQPVRLAHHLLAWCEMLDRDRGRFLDAQARLDECPLGAGALAGTAFPIDRDATCRALGFRVPTANSLDAVADRDFLIEVLAALTNCAVHMSRIAEELVLWSTQEFAFIEMSDTFATGSSMMPQKKNPDMAELMRGKTGRVVGALVSLVVTMKGLPLAYNRDMQEDKEPVFDAVDTVTLGLEVLAPMLAGMRIHGERMGQALHDGFVEATEIADYLAGKEVPFRDAHRVAGEVVAYALDKKQRLGELSLEAYQRFHPAFEEDLMHAIAHETIVERRNHRGGPARVQVMSAIETWKARLEMRESNILKQAASLVQPGA